MMRSLVLTEDGGTTMTYTVEYRPPTCVMRAAALTAMDAGYDTLADYLRTVA